MFEPNPTLVEKLSPPERPLTPEFINSWAGLLYSDSEISGTGRQAIVNYAQAVGRLHMRSEQLAVKAGFFVPQTFIAIPPAGIQDEVHDLYEGYFQGLYKTLSSLAAVTAVFPKVFQNLPFRSMKQFLEAVAKAHPSLESATDSLEHARKYRTLLDHPAGAPVSNWLTFRSVDGRGLRIIFYGNKSRSGGIPPGSEAVTFPFLTQADWIFDVPFAPLTDQALRDLTDVLFRQLLESTE